MKTKPKEKNENKEDVRKVCLKEPANINKGKGPQKTEETKTDNDFQKGADEKKDFWKERQKENKENKQDRKKRRILKTGLLGKQKREASKTAGK